MKHHCKVTDVTLARPVTGISVTLDSNPVFCSLLQPREEIRTEHVRPDPSSDAIGPARGRTRARRSRIDSDLDVRSEEPAHLPWQDGEFPCRTRTLLAGGGAEEAGQTCSGPISSLLQFFIRNISPVPWSSAAFPLHAASILYTSITNSCHLSPDRKYRKFQKHTFTRLIIHFLCGS